MDITKLFISARQRNAWQVFDLTQLVVKHYFVPLMLIVLSVYLPLIIFFSLVFSIPTAAIIIWWLKPLLERPLLDFLSKQSFYQPTTTWSCVLSIKKLKFIDVLSMLTIRRFSPYRAYVAPVEQLEMLTGEKRKKRKNVLLNRNNNKQTFWLIFCMHIEFLLLLLFMIIVINFIPQGFNVDQQFFSFDASFENLEVLYNCCYFFGVMLVAPYYVAGGFLGYLNSRIEMEGWDLELTFKRIAARFRNIASVMVISLCVFTVQSPSLSAQEPNNAQQEQSKTDSDEASTTEVPLNERNIAIRKEVADIYTTHELIEKTPIWLPSEKTEEPKWDLAWLKALFNGLSSVGKIFSYFIWLFLAGLGVWIIYRIYKKGGFKWLGASPKISLKEDKNIELPTFLNEINSTNEPTDLLKAAKEANSEQAFRKALMYLLKYSFVYAQSYSNVVITKSMSEKECEVALLQVLPHGLHSQYQQLFRLWIQQAWAHKEVSQQQVNEVITDFYNTKQELGNND